MWAWLFQHPHHWSECSLNMANAPFSRKHRMSAGRGKSWIVRPFSRPGKLYLPCSRDEMASSVVQLKHCIVDIIHWLSANRLDSMRTKQSCCLLAQDAQSVHAVWLLSSFTARRMIPLPAAVMFVCAVSLTWVWIITFLASVFLLTLPALTNPVLAGFRFCGYPSLHLCDIADWLL